MNRFLAKLRSNMKYGVLTGLTTFTSCQLYNATYSDQIRKSKIARYSIISFTFGSLSFIPVSAFMISFIPLSLALNLFIDYIEEKEIHEHLNIKKKIKKI